MKKLLSEYDFIQAVNLLAVGHNCECYMIDCQEKLIKIRGPEEQQTPCAIAISNFMSNHEVEEVTETIQPAKENYGWVL